MLQFQSFFANMYVHILCSESPVAIALADVMVYDDARKEWLSPDGNTEPARSQVQILHNTQNDSFRIVGTRIQVHMLFMRNCTL